MSGTRKLERFVCSTDDVDHGWDEAVEPEGAGHGVEPQAVDPSEDPPIDIRSASRSANTAASLGRAPAPAPTTKIQPFQLAEALARATSQDG